MLIRVLIFGFGLVAIGSVLTLIRGSAGPIPVQKSLESTRQTIRSAFKFPDLSEKLEVAVSPIIKNPPENYAVSVVDLTSDQKFGINDQQSFDAASTIKVLVAVYALEQIDQGKVKFETKIGNLSLSEHLRLMINRSDNDSWGVLNEYFGLANIGNYGKSLGMKSTNLFNNETTAGDLAALLAKIDSGQILKDQSRTKFLSWMQNTETEERIPAALDDDFKIYHKAGTYQSVVHDAAIIEGKGKRFVLVILSEGKTDVKNRLETFSLITRAVAENI